MTDQEKQELIDIIAKARGIAMLSQLRTWLDDKEKIEQVLWEALVKLGWK